MSSAPSRDRTSKSGSGDFSFPGVPGREGTSFKPSPRSPPDPVLMLSELVQLFWREGLDGVGAIIAGCDTVLSDKSEVSSTLARRVCAGLDFPESPSTPPHRSDGGLFAFNSSPPL